MRTYLKKMRESKGFTMRDMADKLDISESYYSLIESGARQRNLDITIASRLSAILQISLTDIVSAEQALRKS